MFKRAVNKSYIFDGYWVDPETNIVYTRINCKTGTINSPETGRVIKLNTPYSVLDNNWNTAEYEWVIEGDLLVQYRKDDGKITKSVYTNTVNKFVTEYLKRVNRSADLMVLFLPELQELCSSSNMFCREVREMEDNYDTVMFTDGVGTPWEQIAKNSYINTGGKIYKAFREVTIYMGIDPKDYGVRGIEPYEHYHYFIPQN